MTSFIEKAGKSKEQKLPVVIFIHVFRNTQQALLTVIMLIKLGIQPGIRYA